MILINQTPPGADQDFAALYQNMSSEGLVHSTLMHGEHYEASDDFEEEWACPAITWSAAGKELYRLDNGKTYAINPAGVLILGAGTRYDYAAGRDAVFYSNMVTFPHWMTVAENSDLLDADVKDHRRLSTRMHHPDTEMLALMNEMVLHCRAGFSDHQWYSEKAALLYSMLLNAEHSATAAGSDINAAKPATKTELARRIRRAQEFMLQSYCDADLDISAIAKAACLSPFHLIRVFKSLTSVTPMQYLGAVRMEAARHLLKETALTASEIATHVGFGNRSAFSRAFSRHHGFAPSAVRANWAT